MPLDSSRLAPRASDSSFGTQPRPCQGAAVFYGSPGEGGASRPGLEHSLRSGPRDGLGGHDHVDGVARAESKGDDSSGHQEPGCADEASSRIAAWLWPRWRASMPW